MSIIVSQLDSGILSYQFYSRLFSRPSHYLIAIALLSLSNFIYQLNYHTWSIVFDATLWNPTWLLMGPLLLMLRYKKEQKKKSFALTIAHLSPFIIMVVFFISTSYHSSFSEENQDGLLEIYQKFFILVPISLLFYGIINFFPIRKKSSELAPFDDLQLIISGFYVLIAAVSVMMYFCWRVLKVDMVVDYRIIIYALLSVMVTVIFYYLSSLNNLAQPDLIKSAEAEHISTLSLGQVNEYERKLQNYLVNEQAFLNSNLSLSVLSGKLQIPKHHLSLLFNQRLGKSFYSYLATLRINFALAELEKEGNIYTVESLAYKAGFNSKTSFHKYFKEYTGLTPIAYINQNG